MINRPLLPLDTKARELVDFCLYFDSEAGFIAQYETKLAELHMSVGKKKGVKSAAYEATEQFFCQLLNKGRKFSDSDSFKSALYRFRRRKR